MEPRATSLHHRWTEALPTKKKTANVVTKKLLDDIFPRYEIPQILGSDNGPAFVSQPYPRGTPPSPPIDAKDGVKTPACREQLNRPVVPHPFKIGDSVWVRRHQSRNLEPRLTGQRLGSTRRM
ncbi:uncharacterized protein LOC143272258 [Peromyscus maniculatus bairdii]|uniref:uncharacterized protein LOC143270526 n=1 Tax=Peromyscus maniculatus bairdii TaxID=230844 RepID=UPI003FD258E0